MLLSWEEDDLGCIQEIHTLKQFFEGQFGYTVETWLIPSRNSETELQTRLHTFVNPVTSGEELRIVYYGGHGLIDRKTDRLNLFARHGPRSPQLEWNRVQERVLFPATPDVAIILDSCYAGGAIRGPSHGGRKEILAACGRDTPTPGGVDDGTSFAAYLMRVFLKISNAFTISQAYEQLRLLARQKILEYMPKYETVVNPQKLPIVLTPKLRLNSANSDKEDRDEEDEESDTHGQQPSPEAYRKAVHTLMRQGEYCNV